MIDPLRLARLQSLMGGVSSGVPVPQTGQVPQMPQPQGLPQMPQPQPQKMSQPSGPAAPQGPTAQKPNPGQAPPPPSPGTASTVTPPAPNVSTTPPQGMREFNFQEWNTQRQAQPGEAGDFSYHDEDRFKYEWDRVFAALRGMDANTRAQVDEYYSQHFANTQPGKGRGLNAYIKAINAVTGGNAQ